MPADEHEYACEPGVGRSRGPRASRMQGRGEPRSDLYGGRGGGRGGAAGAASEAGELALLDDEARGELGAGAHGVEGQALLGERDLGAEGRGDLLGEGFSQLVSDRAIHIQRGRVSSGCVIGIVTV